MIGEKQQQSPEQSNGVLRQQMLAAKMHRAAWLIAGAGIIAAASLIPGQALPIVSAVGIYFLLMLLFRLAGKRTMANLSTFDLILLLIISETTQQTMVRDNNTFTNAALLVSTLVVLDIGMSLLKLKFPRFEQLLEGESLVIVENGLPLHDRMKLARVDVDDVLAAARQSRGIEHLEEIKLAVLEAGGGISIIPRKAPAVHPLPLQKVREFDST